MVRVVSLYLESQWLIIMGYFKPIMVYFGVEWPTISSYLAVQVCQRKNCKLVWLPQLPLLNSLNFKLLSGWSTEYSHFLKSTVVATLAVQIMGPKPLGTVEYAINHTPKA